MRDKLGLCASPEAPSEERLIWINPAAPKEQIINSLVHEIIHAELWSLDEEYVGRMADSIVEALKQSGALKLEE